MHYIIEPTGCVERKGMMQIRFSCILDPGDFRYNDFFVDVPDYAGVNPYAGKHFLTVDEVKHIPKKKVLIPFLDHFDYFDPDVSDSVIHSRGVDILTKGYAQHSMGISPALKNKNLKPPEYNDKDRSDKCIKRIEKIKGGK